MPELSESHVDLDPVALFDLWFRDACAAVPINPNAMTLVTATLDAKPSARMVLLKDFDVNGFVFYTNYHSRKGKEIARNPHVAAVFYWPSLDRQIRIEGRAEPVSERESDEYFASRPRGSQLSAWASQQSEEILDRAVLEEKVATVSRRFEKDDVPRPPFWGGFRIRPDAVEFWQGRQDRLHDRLRYVRNEDETWSVNRLSP